MKRKLNKMSKLNQIGLIFKNLYYKFESYLFDGQADPTALALFRILFGLLMLLDVPQERGLQDADIHFNDPNHCFFPLFNFIGPVQVHYACILYSIMWIGSLGITIGFNFHTSCIMYLLPYLYFYLLDKSRWNNHSYLFILTTILLFVSEAGNVYSIDKLWSTRQQKPTTATASTNSLLLKTTIPQWNYLLLKFQLFILYFYAGLKKLINSDWLAGYSMRNITRHWIFGPISSLVDDRLINYYVIHIGGLVFDLSIGFLLNIKATKKFAFLLSFMFHGLNSQLFDIGMFPYVCLASLVIFCEPYEFPCNLFSGVVAQPPSSSSQTTHAGHKSSKKKKNKSKKSSEPLAKPFAPQPPPPQRSIQKIPPISGKRWKTSLMCFYVCVQLLLPFTHFVTKGYNNWTNGMYGYSWDMMVYSWSTLHTKVTVKNNVTGELRFLDPNVWTVNDRWSSHADMAKQYAACIQRNLSPASASSPPQPISIYFDVWKSLNGNFQQRIFDPRVDILTAPWSPWSNTSWILPLLHEYSYWRTSQFEQIANHVSTWSNTSNVIFISDYPGLYLENYLPEYLTNVSLVILNGEIRFEEKIDGGRSSSGEHSISLINKDPSSIDKMLNSKSPNIRHSIRVGKFHKIHTVSSQPACYMYTYNNLTSTSPVASGVSAGDGEPEPGEHLCIRIINTAKEFLLEKIDVFSRSGYLIINSYLHVLYGVPMVVRKPVEGT